MLLPNILDKSPFLDHDQVILRSHVHSWSEENLLSKDPNVRDIEGEAIRLVQALGEEGLLAYVAPKRFGGVKEKVQARDLCVLREELAWGSALADTMFAMQALGSYPLILAGTDAQQARYLPPAAQGKAIAAFALTEPQAGSDIVSIATKASKHGREYILEGTKTLISNAGLAQTYVVFAVTDPGKKSKGISAFVVEADTPGLTLKEKLDTLSPHPIGAVAFNECRIPQDQILGKEGEGIQLALQTLDTLRCTVGAAAVGIAKRALEEAIGYTQKRKQFNRNLSEFQGIQFKLADMATELEAARLLAYQAAWIHDHQKEDLTAKSSMAKLFATEAAQRIVDQAVQIHGGIGVTQSHIMGRLYNDVRPLRIYEGTSEIQRIIIARSLLREQRKG